MTPVRAYISDRSDREAMVWGHYRTFDVGASGPIPLWRAAYFASLERAGVRELDWILGAAEPFKAVPVGHGLLPFMPEGREATLALTEAITAILPELDRLAASR